MCIKNRRRSQEWYLAVVSLPCYYPFSGIWTTHTLATSLDLISPFFFLIASWDFQKFYSFLCLLAIDILSLSSPVIGICSERKKSCLENIGCHFSNFLLSGILGSHTLVACLLSDAFKQIWSTHFQKLAFLLFSVVALPAPIYSVMVASPAPLVISYACLHEPGQSLSSSSHHILHRILYSNYHCEG